MKKHVIMNGLLIKYGLIIVVGIFLGEGLQAQVVIDYNSSSGSPHLILSESENDFSRLQFKNINSGAGEYWSIASRISENDNLSRMHIYYNGHSVSGFIMALTGEKRIGIGTLTPDARLTVKQDNNSSDMGVRLIDASGAHSGRLWLNGEDFHIQKGSDDQNGFVLKPDRRIGVFTDNPTAKFDIFESDHSAQDDIFLVRRQKLIPPNLISSVKILEAQEDCDVYVHKLGVREEDPTDYIHISGTANGDHIFRAQIAGNTKFRILNNGGTSIGGNNEGPPQDGLYVKERVVIGTSDLTDTDMLKVRAEVGNNGLRVAIGSATKLRVLSNGGTSIGSNNTSPPDDGLYVNGDVNIGTTTGATGYKVSVDGKIICEELTVKLSGTWPDYVFDTDYPLLPLNELEDFISKNHHLPGIPEASRMENSGVHLSEIVTTLVEKIEELTLHVINHEKQALQQQLLIDQLLSQNEN